MITVLLFNQYGLLGCKPLCTNIYPTFVFQWILGCAVLTRFPWNLQTDFVAIFASIFFFSLSLSLVNSPYLLSWYIPCMLLYLYIDLRLCRDVFSFLQDFHSHGLFCCYEVLRWNSCSLTLNDSFGKLLVILNDLAPCMYPLDDSTRVWYIGFVW